MVYFNFMSVIFFLLSSLSPCCFLNISKYFIVTILKAYIYIYIYLFIFIIMSSKWHQIFPQCLLLLWNCFFSTHLHEYMYCHKYIFIIAGSVICAEGKFVKGLNVPRPFPLLSRYIVL